MNRILKDKSDSREVDQCNLRTSFVTVDANASAKPASDASILGVRMAMRPVTPTIALDRRLNRMDSQRFTIAAVSL